MMAKKWVCTAEIEIEADTKEDAEIELTRMMDEHRIWWEIEED